MLNSLFTAKFYGHGENDGFGKYMHTTKHCSSFCKYTNINVVVFDCLGFIVPLENFSLIWRPLLSVKSCKFLTCARHSSAYGHWAGFFSVSHLLWHEASVYNGHLWGPVTLTSIAERLVIELSLPDLGLSRLEIEHRTFSLRGQHSNPLCQRRDLHDVMNEIRNK